MLDAPQFTLSVTGSDPKLTSKSLLEGGVNDVIFQLLQLLQGYTDDEIAELRSHVDQADNLLRDQLQAIATGLRVTGEWDAPSGAFPAGADLGTYYLVSGAGSVDGESFAVGDWLIPLQADASTSTYAGNWATGRYSQVLDGADGRAFDTVQQAIDATDVSAGQSITIAGRQYKTLAAGTYTANGLGVIDMSGSGLQAVIAEVLASAEDAASLDALVTAAIDAGQNTAAAVRNLWNDVAAPYGFTKLDRIKPEWGGAKGDETEAATTTTALNAAAAYCAREGKVLSLAKAGSYAVNDYIVLPSGLVVEDDGAYFHVIAAKTGPDRDTGIIKLENGVRANRLGLSLPAGVNTLAIGFDIGADCDVGDIDAHSEDYNNNITDTDDDHERFATVLIRGDRSAADFIKTNKFRVGLRVRGADGVRIGRSHHVDASLGINPRDVTNFHLGSWRVEAVAYATQTRTWNTNGMITGENGLLVGGAQDSYFGDGWCYDALEHSIRVGAGTERTNNRITFGKQYLYRSYGCGFKADDGDAHTTTDLHVQHVYAEDVGRDLENGVTSDWGNKEALAIRNVERFGVESFTSRALNYSYCGGYGVWVEKSSKGHVLNIDGENAAQRGVSLNTNGIDCYDVTLKGRTVLSGGDGVVIDPNQNGDVMNRVIVEIDSLQNTGTSVRVNDRPDGTAAFSGPVLVRSFSRGSATTKTIGTASAAAGNFFDKIENS